ncbi:mycofactocin biosynthesis chaperone MftB [Luteipulveratus halotolerans]|uniref:Mycofactocin system RPExFGAL protein n=1 Tax=Luteipulveratus halotolerans TaxID=1631356 RepID=A0A0L6CJC6_9MICO|nr:mycofactocin biosynthesis chaperone MftB [Luteipulveratus halotolerans]KNX37897.1 hypothetical protein VV01_13195 [Luteipulveratus halotolerans]
MLHETWALNGSVALRPEPFGALAYDFTTRRLTFLKSTELVDVVRRLADSGDVAHALSAAGVQEREWDRYVEALRSLAATGMLTRTGAAA